MTVGKQATDPQAARDYWTPARVKEVLANEKQDAGEGPRRTAEAPPVLPAGGPMATTEGQIVGANSHAEVDDNGERINDNLYCSDHGSQAIAVINRINELN